MAKLRIDGNEIEVPDHFTLLQACEDAGAEVPRFCFHERLSVAALPHVPCRGEGRPAEAAGFLRHERARYPRRPERRTA